MNATAAPTKTKPARTPAAALALGAALVLGAAGEAAAQGVCAGALPTAPNSNVGGVRIVCQESNPSASGIRINAESVTLSVTSSNFAFRPAIDARLNSASDENDVNVRLGRGLVISTGAAREAFIGAYARNAGSGATTVVMEDGASITTTGGDADGIRYSNPSTATGTTDVRMTGGSITTSGTEAHGIYILHNGSGASTVSMSGGAIKASGSLSSGIYVNKQRGSGDATITFSGGSIEKSGGDGAGIGFYGNPAANAANARIRVTGGSIAVEGVANAHGVYVDHRGAGGGDVAMTGGSITASGDSFSHGVFAFLRNAANEAPIVIGMAGGSIATKGRASLGLYGAHRGLGSVTVTMEGEAEIATSGDSSEGMFALLDNAANEAAIVIGMAGGSVATEGRRSSGLYGAHHGLGSVTVTTGGEAEIETPFAVGVEGRLVNAANAAGRLVVTHGGAVEAGDVGVLAWAARRSGHTSGDGAEEADDAARTEPMIHVTSSGDVTVGAQVTDAFIRNRIAGDDGTLSARERAVLDAITADDSDALTTALEALPADYDDDWKAEAENLRRKRAEGTDDSVLAARATEEILGLTRAGVRALALSHETITGHVRFGDGDRAFSDAERTALEAALTGRGLETALAALPAAYTDAWKDTLRAHAASYNAGDIQVDVTGGTIAAEGDGVDARYALAHDRNGAIAVTVADGAEITGGRHGVHVGGAGLAAGGGLRDQTVTVNGAVMGGTGAGVHLAGGGRVTVGRTGRVGATSGDAVLSDGAGGLVATVAGAVEGHVRAEGGGDLTVTVEREGEIAGDVRAEGGGDLSATVLGMVKGDLRAMDGGALTVDVREGSEVTGTVHDPVGPLTVRGFVGRLLYGDGATVTVARTGRLTGVEGEALRSAAGDLTLTVAGMVAGDVRGLGDGDLAAVVSGRIDGDLVEEGAGDLRATISGAVAGDVFGRGAGEHVVAVAAGGTVTGVIHLSASTVTVNGEAGQVRFDDGGAVTVGATGRILGIEDVGIRVGVRSETGDLSATIAGAVTGDVLALGSGEHRASVLEGGRVSGRVRLAAAGGVVTVGGVAGQVLLDGGGSVTVGEAGEIVGVAEDPDDPDAIRSERGELEVTVCRGAGETLRGAAGRLGGRRIVEKGGVPRVLYRAGCGGPAVEIGALGAPEAAPDGAFDVGLAADEDGGVRLRPEYAPRSRVYEALPSALLGLNDLPTHRDRLSALRSSNGIWARVEAEGGERRAKRSTSAAALSYDHRRYGVRTGVDVPLGASGMAGVSAHRLRGSAELSGKDGEIEASGAGFGVSGAWRFPDGVYVDGQAQATWYEADVKSGLRGMLKSGARGFGYALGLEAGRRLALGVVTLTPRARLARSQLRLNDFTDALGGRVSLEKGRSVTGRAGLRVEAAPSGPGGGRLFASAEVEREFVAETRMRVSGEGLSSERDATRARLALGGSHEWGEGRYAVQGAASYAAGRRGNRSYGGALNLKLRF